MYALLIKNEKGYTVVEHVSNYADDTVNVPDWSEYGLKQSEYRKAHHLLAEVREQHPKWAVQVWEFDIMDLFKISHPVA